MRTDFDWCNGKYVPDDSCYCLCEMEGMPFPKYTVCRWDGMYWLIWIYINKEVHAWCGLPQEWKIKQWCVIGYE